jgi:hypothetical protein
MVDQMTESQYDVKLHLKVKCPHVAEHDLCPDDARQHRFRVVDGDNSVTVRSKRIGDPPGAAAEIEDPCSGPNQRTDATQFRLGWQRSVDLHWRSVRSDVSHTPSIESTLEQIARSGSSTQA